MADVDEMESVDSAVNSKEGTEVVKKVEEEIEEIKTLQDDQKVGEASKNGSNSPEKSPEKKSEVKRGTHTEIELGMSEYLGQHKGFFGILKQRYSDFVVHEVNSAGEEVHLTDRKIPRIPEIIPEMPDELPPELTPDILEQLDELIGVPRSARIPLVPLAKESEEDAEMKEVLSETAKETEKKTPQGKSPKKKNKGEVVICVNGVTKEGRANIHRAVKAKYKSVVSCYKEDDDGNKFILIQKHIAGGNIPRRSTWPKSQMYTTFVLYKENIDTMDAVSHLAKKTGVKANMFAYAGTKDRRAKTCQLVSVPRVAPEKLHQAANFRSIHLGNFTFMPTPQKLGQLRGNKFHIVLREVKDDDEVITSAVDALKTNGFINYFGSQRFGTSSISSHSIGLELLKSNWQKAVILILACRDNDHPILNKCRKVWNESGDAEAALRVLGRERESSIEGKLLMGLKNRKNDLVGALALIPRNVRMIYLHAYQSLIWNKVVSRRIKKYGLTVLPGDMVRGKDLANTKDEDVLEEEEEEEDGEDESNGSCVETNNSEKEVEEKDKDKFNFHFLSEEEAKTTHISDVFLPLPGHKVQFPQNEIKDWYTELLEADELDIAALNHRVKCYSVSGSYRRIIVQPTDVSSCITYYKDPTLPLIQSDMDKLMKESVDDNLLKEGPNKAVIIKMTLRSSSYATMALRELLKMDTSSAFQATLNKSRPTPSNKTSTERGGFSRGGYHGRDDHWSDNRGRGHNRGRGRGWQSHGGRRFHSDRGSSRGFGNGRNRGEKRPWRGSHGRGGKRGRF